MSAARASYHHGALAEGAVQAALEAIGEHGVDGFSLRDIARRVGVTHVAFYRHYQDRRALLTEVAQRGFALLTERLERARQRAPAGEEVRAAVRAYLRFAVEEPAYYRVMFGPRLNEDGRHPELERRVQEAFAWLVALVGGAEGPGQRELAMALWITLHGFCDLHLMGRVRARSRARLLDYGLRLSEPVVEAIVARRRGGH